VLNQRHPLKTTEGDAHGEWDSPRLAPGA
jgi:hypothetical protein